MANNSVEILLKERDKIVMEKEAAISRFNAEIQDLETSIERLSGKKVWEMPREALYDDEHPDYIKQSIEE